VGVKNALFYIYSNFVKPHNFDKFWHIFAFSVSYHIPYFTFFV